jgi:single-stranded-DNA-specific exonuclease
VDRFRERLGAVLAERGGALEDRSPPLEIDLAVALPSLSCDVVRDLDRLEPYGCGNEPPLLAARDLAVVTRPRRVGRGSEHLSLEVREGRSVLRTIGFGLGPRADAIEAAGREGRVDLAFRPIISRFGGGERLELEVRDIRVRAVEHGSCASPR